MPYVYLLRCSDGSFYVGSSRDLDQWVAEHASGVVKGYTSTRLPVELVWALETERMDDAAELERQIKGWRRAKRLALIDGRLADLPALSRTGSHEPAGSSTPTPPGPFDKLRERGGATA